MYENDRNIEDVMAESLESISKTQIQDIKNFCEERKEYLEMLINSLKGTFKLIFLSCKDNFPRCLYT